MAVGADSLDPCSHRVATERLGRSDVVVPMAVDADHDDLVGGNGFRVSQRRADTVEVGQISLGDGRRQTVTLHHRRITVAAYAEQG